MSTTDPGSPLRESMEQMRRAFDQLFAAPEPPPAEASDDFVSVRVGGLPFLLPVSELAWIETQRKIVPLPGSHSWLLGLAATRGKLVPVYSLELALGLPATPAPKACIAVCDREAPVGLALESLVGYFRVPRSDVLSDTGAGEPGKQHAARVAGEVWPVVSVASIHVAIRELASLRGKSEEA